MKSKAWRRWADGAHNETPGRLPFLEFGHEALGNASVFFGGGYAIVFMYTYIYIMYIYI